MKERQSITTKQTVLMVILAIVVLVISQVLALSVGELSVTAGLPVAVGNIFTSILYAGFACLGVSLMCRNILKMQMDVLRITKFQLEPVWVITAILMPVFVLVLAMAAGGEWESNVFPAGQTLATVTGAVFFYGLATGFVEETIFRGVIMGVLEMRWNKGIAIFVPSVIFGLLHIIGNELSFLSIIQLLIAGSIVGILFSLITYAGGSVWNTAFVHAVWNMAIVGGILHIGSSADTGSMFNFVLDSEAFLITGGDFGIEASVISIVIYLLFIAAAYWIGKRKEI